MIALCATSSVELRGCVASASAKRHGGLEICFWVPRKQWSLLPEAGVDFIAAERAPAGVRGVPTGQMLGCPCACTKRAIVEELLI
jgi:hypothetical protein